MRWYLGRDDQRRGSSIHKNAFSAFKTWQWRSVELYDTSRGDLRGTFKLLPGAGRSYGHRLRQYDSDTRVLSPRQAVFAINFALPKSTGGYRAIIVLNCIATLYVLSKLLRTFYFQFRIDTIFDIEIFVVQYTMQYTGSVIKRWSRRVYKIHYIYIFILESVLLLHCTRSSIHRS